MFTITLANRNNFLRTLLPSAVGDDRYVAFFSSLPDSAGLGGVEVSAGDYKRVICNFNGAVEDFVSVRFNAIEVVFPIVDVAYTVQGIGIYDTFTLGQLKASVPLRLADDGTLLIKQFNIGDGPRFQVGTIRIKVA